MDIILILYMRILGLCEVKKIAEDHVDSREQIWDSAHPASEHMLLVWDQWPRLVGQCLILSMESHRHCKVLECWIPVLLVAA